MISSVPTQQLDVSVAIPTYNGAQRLPCLLDRLRSQQHVSHISWEIIVCDNNSLDETAQVVRHYQRTWTGAAELRYCFAAEQGAAFARQRAVERARGKLIAFLDDDNLPESNWIANAWSFAQQHPEAGAFGSQIHGDFEQTPPKEFKEIACFLAIVERGPNPHRYDQNTKVLPPGAGLVVRRDAWLQSVPRRLFLNNKGKAAGLASEDLEAVLYIRNAGWEIWYNPAMVVYHQIPSNRLNIEYLKTLFRCVGLSRFYIRWLSIAKWQCLIFMPACIINDIRNLVLHQIHRNSSKTPAWLLDCQHEYLRSSIASPFFLLKKSYQNTRKRQQFCQLVSAEEQRFWLQQLTHGFEQDQFQLYQQSVIKLDHKSNPEIQREILLRLGKPACSSPKDFRIVVEKYGLARTIDRWVLRQCFDTLAELQSNGNSAVPYSINLFGASVCDLNLTNYIEELLKFANLSPQQICFEISESVASKHSKEFLNLCYGLKGLGCLVAIDDLSIHQNSYQFLAQLPIEYIKLHNHCLRSVAGNRGAFKLLQELLDRNQEAGIKTIVKGVETYSLIEQTKLLGVKYAQGYGLAMPQPLNSTPSPNQAEITSSVTRIGDSFSDILR